MADRISPTIRPALLTDLPAIVAMRNRLNKHELEGCPHAPIQPLSLEEFTTLWGKTIDEPTHCWRIMEAETEPLGFGLIYLVTPPPQTPAAFIHWAFVKEGHRGQGNGQLLLDELLGWARQQGANRVELQYIDGNAIAEQFWTSRGFLPYARKCVHVL